MIKSEQFPSNLELQTEIQGQFFISTRKTIKHRPS